MTFGANSPFPFIDLAVPFCLQPQTHIKIGGVAAFDFFACGGETRATCVSFRKKLERSTMSRVTQVFTGSLQILEHIVLRHVYWSLTGPLPLTLADTAWCP